jgi:hypothetical protein
MEFLNNIRSFIANLDEKTWYRYIAAILGVYLLIIGGIIYYSYSSINALHEEIETVNESRKKAQRILSDALRVQKQRAEINAILEEEPDFKIKGYMQDLMARLGFTKANIISDNETNIARDDFTENIVNYQLTGITMKQLTELLDDIEHNPRLYTKDLEISKSKKIPNTIDVSITVATMIPKPKS